MRMILFGIVAMIIWGGIHFYVGRRLITGSHLPKPWNYVGWTLIAVHASLSPIAAGLRRSSALPELLIVLQWVTYVGMGFFIMLLTLLLARDLVFFVSGKLGWFEPRDPFPDDPNRRTLLTSGLNLGIFAASGVATGVGYVSARGKPRVDEVVLEVPGLPAALDGFRIIQFSDLHVGPTIRKPFVDTIVGIMNELDADIIAMTGDLVDGDPPDLRDELAPLKTLKSRHGVYYVTGNHEYYWNAEAWRREAEALGMKPLSNAHAVVRVGGASVLVGGVDDLRADRFGESSDPHQAKADAPRHDFSVLLAHRPGSCYQAAAAGWNLQLSGHTHGGQFYPWNFFVGLAHPFTAGLGRHENTWVYVNRGTGYWGPPMRLGIPSEITAITLKSVQVAGVFGRRA